MTYSFLLSFLKFISQRERERNINLLSHSFIHSLVDSCMCPDWGSNLQRWHVWTTLQTTEPLCQSSSSAFNPCDFRALCSPSSFFVNFRQSVDLREQEPRVWLLRTPSSPCSSHNNEIFQFSVYIGYLGDLVNHRLTLGFVPI